MYSTMIVALFSLLVALFALMFASYNVRINLGTVLLELYRINATESSYKIINNAVNEILSGEQIIFNAIMGIIGIIIVVTFLFLRIVNILDNIMMSRDVDLEQLRIKWFRRSYRNKKKRLNYDRYEL